MLASLGPARDDARRGRDGAGAPARRRSRGLTHERATAAEIGEWLAELDGDDLDELDARHRAPRPSRLGARATRARRSRRGDLAGRTPTDRRAGSVARANGRLRRLRAGARAQRRARARLRRCLAEEGRGAYQALIDDFDFGLRTDELRRVCSGRSRSASRRWSSEARAARPRRSAGGPGRRPAARRSRPRCGASASIGESWRLDVSAHPFTASMAPARPAHDDPLRRRRHRVAAQLAARVRARALRAPGRPRAGANQPRHRDLDVDPRVPEQAVGEPRRPPSRLRRGAGERARARPAFEIERRRAARGAGRPSSPR